MSVFLSVCLCLSLHKIRGGAGPLGPSPRSATGFGVQFGINLHEWVFHFQAEIARAASAKNLQVQINFRLNGENRMITY